MKSTIRDILKEVKEVDYDAATQSGKAPPQTGLLRRKSSLSEIVIEQPKFIWRKILRMTMATMYDANNGGIYILEKHPDAFNIIVIYYALFFATFGIFIWLLTIQGISNTYLSPQGSGSGQTCTEVPKIITQQVYGDIHGTWSTDTAYQQNSSAFSLQFTGSNLTTIQYKVAMAKFKDQLYQLSRKSAMRDAGWNSVMWSTFYFQDKTTNMAFSSSADAGTIFNADTTVGVLTSAKSGMCKNVYQLGQYDHSKKNLVYTVKTEPVSESQLAGYVNLTGNTLPVLPSVDYVYGAPWQEACPDAYPSYNWSTYEPSAQTGIMKLSYDVTTVANVISINMNITQLTDYTRLGSAFGLDASGGLPGAFYYDPFYLGQEPFFCVDKVALNKKGIISLTPAQIDGPDLCFIVRPTKFKPIFYYPIALSVFTQTSTSGTTLVFQCTCPRDANNPGCNDRNYMVGLVYDTDRGDMTKPLRFALQMQKLLIDDPINGDLQMQEMVFPMMSTAWWVSPPGGPAYASAPYPGANASLSAAAYHVQTWKALCPWGSCAAVLFASFQGAGDVTVQPLNIFEYQARMAPWLNATYTTSTGSVRKQEMCVNTIYNVAVMDKLLSQTPLDLVEKYYVCSYTLSASFAQAVGNGGCTAQTIATVAVCIIGWFMREIYHHRLRFLRWQWWCGGHPYQQPVVAVEQTSIEFIASEKSPVDGGSGTFGSAAGGGSGGVKKLSMREMIQVREAAEDGGSKDASMNVRPFTTLADNPYASSELPATIDEMRGTMQAMAAQLAQLQREVHELRSK